MGEQILRRDVMNPATEGQQAFVYKFIMKMFNGGIHF